MAENINDIVGRAITALLRQDCGDVGGNCPFFGHLLLQFNRIITDNVPTAGVSITDKINLYINPTFFTQLPLEQQVGLLKHEIYHIINYHPSRGVGRNHKVFNIACDLAINQFIHNLPEGKMKDKDGKEHDFHPCKFEDFKKEYPKAQEKDAAEVYYEMMMKDQEKFEKIMQQLFDEALEDLKNEGGEGDGQGKKEGKQQVGDMQSKGCTTDDHEKWEEGQGALDKEYVKEKIKDMIKQTYEKCKEFGNIPSEVVSQIAKIAEESLVNWKAEMRRFAMFATQYGSVSSWRRKNRRFDGIKGSVIDPKLKIGVCVDTSGSIGDDELGQFSAEIHKIYQFTKDIKVIECDCEVKRTYPYKGKIVKDWRGRGGTAFNPALAAAEKMHVDVIFYLTDGYPCKQVQKCKVPVMWVITPHGVKTRDFANFGHFVKMKERGEFND